MSASHFVGEINGARQDESAVRLLFVAHSPDYAALVRETLERAPRGRFEVQCADQLEPAMHDLEEDRYDALLVDLTESPDDGGSTIEAAARIAGRLPVIVLTGDPPKPATQAELDATAVRDRIAHSPLPREILSAVRRSRRLGQHGASEPIVLRDPLRVLARAFAKLHASLRR